MWEMEDAYKILVRKSEGKRPCKKPRCTYEEKLELDLEEIMWEGVGWMQMTQDRDQWWALVIAVMNLWVP
jgi:hypothetical protein